MDLFAGITTDNLEDIKKLYETQCPSIYNQGMSVDPGLLQVIAIGKKIRIDYLQHLVDVYDRARVQVLKKDATNK